MSRYSNKVNDTESKIKYEKVMKASNTTSASSDLEFLGSKSAELEALLTGHWFTDLANFSAFLFYEVPDLNWAGFYFSDGRQLILGPFAGKPACTSIRFDRGVCGAAFSSRQPVLVDDVHAFPGHIACDAASNAEMVLPILIDDECVGVLDLDSPSRGRFQAEDLELVGAWLRILLTKCDLRPLVRGLRS